MRLAAHHQFVTKVYTSKPSAWKQSDQTLRSIQRNKVKEKNRIVCMKPF